MTTTRRRWRGDDEMKVRRRRQIQLKIRFSLGEKSFSPHLSCFKSALIVLRSRPRGIGKFFHYLENYESIFSHSPGAFRVTSMSCRFAFQLTSWKERRKGPGEVASEVEEIDHKLPSCKTMMLYFPGMKFTSQFISKCSCETFISRVSFMIQIYFARWHFNFLHVDSSRRKKAKEVWTNLPGAILFCTFHFDTFNMHILSFYEFKSSFLTASSNRSWWRKSEFIISFVEQCKRWWKKSFWSFCTLLSLR